MDALQRRVGLVLVEVRAAVAVQQLPPPVLIVVRVSVLGSETCDGLWVSHWFAREGRAWKDENAVGVAWVDERDVRKEQGVKK